MKILGGDFHTKKPIPVIPPKVEIKIKRGRRSLHAGCHRYDVNPHATFQLKSRVTYL